MEEYNKPKAQEYRESIIEQGITTDLLNTRVSKLNTTIINNNNRVTQDTEMIRSLKSELTLK
jgi:hypothetical protein